ncbi:peptide chain release factor 3 [Monoraphidium neglectum]|uniref:Peptide chain release factor 3 n=1 Tax=Monoraphidium neglectum TaxID=145388 RepID=A0A0D2MAQ8_9CHLO|nr:peptide chain release factor 3 [Monoraphidium neglectum]KIZ00365.1 peptide chain release factor 3 [Monoraphidium neglectum]|eukprot:XP_013899384.1 peptide chain release factor 3 [Monoraphidium neglectum]
MDSQDEEAAASAKAEAAQLTREQIAREVKRRRNFAIISHPDAGKTTLTEKLLLFGGAIHEAGEVKARANRRSATSDWMELEKARGISITSTAMTFSYSDMQINLLDTPGHQDFSEDTYRTLAAADNAVMLVDGAKGIEEQTRKLFAVARLRGLPIFTVVNKMDRPALNGFEIIEQLEKEFGLASFPVTWPIGSGDRFCGLYHRPSRKVILYKKGLRGRAATKETYDISDPELAGLVEGDLYEQLLEDVELLEVLGDELDQAEVAAGNVAPMYFCSAFNQFGVDLFLEHFTATAAPPGPSKASLVFKLQSNMDPRHRDKVAFVRVVSGKFSKGMKVKVARTGRTVALSRPQRMFAQDRSTVQEGFAGDVIGLSNPGAFAVGDTVFAGPEVAFPPIPSFSPELFSYMRCAPNQRKAFAKGVDALLGEGAVQVLYSTDEYKQDPILAAVGQLQFEVVQFRMKDEYGVDTTLEPMPYAIARWVRAGWPAVEAAGRLFNTLTVKDMWGRPVLLFRNAFALSQVEAEQGEKLGELSPFALPPDS